MRLFIKLMDDWLTEAQEDGVQIIHIGNKTRLPKRLLAKITEVEQLTRHNDRFVLNLALDYGGHDEITRASDRLQAATAEGASLADYLDTAGQPHPDPDFIIRTSGEMRLSGFMPWQSVYSELYFEPCFFPDFTTARLDVAIAEFHRRQRRFGAGH